MEHGENLCHNDFLVHDKVLHAPQPQRTLIFRTLLLLRTQHG